MKSELEPKSTAALHSATAAIEAGAGLALLFFPSVTVELLLGAPLKAPASLAVARVGGTALLALGIACWLARDDTQSPTARGLVAAMVVYNLGIVVVLGTAGIRSLPAGFVLWPAAVLLHGAMAAWCILSLVRGKARDETSSSGALGLQGRQDQ